MRRKPLPCGRAAGDDLLYGKLGDDTLLGGTGNDLLDGGKGADEMHGARLKGECKPLLRRSVWCSQRARTG